MDIELNGLDILGIDASLNGTALHFLSDTEGIKLDPGDCVGVERLVNLRAELYDALKGRDVGVVIMEGYSYGSASRAHSIGEWGGILRLSLCDYLPGLRYIVIVPPSTLKKFVIGHAKPGKSGKEIMILNTYKKWGIEIPDNDLCDAHALAKVGEVIFYRGGTAAESHTLLKVEKINVEGL